MENFLLSKAKPNKLYTIVNMCSDIDIKTKTRLFELGFFSGEKIRVLNFSLLGGVMLVELRSQVLTIRKQEASCVVVHE